MSMIRSSVHSNPSRKRNFSETLFNPRNLKHSFISKVRPIVHTYPSWGIWERRLWVSVCTQMVNIFKTELSEIKSPSWQTCLLIVTLKGAISQAFPSPAIASFEERFGKAPFQRSVNGKHLINFRTKTLFQNFSGVVCRRGLIICFFFQWSLNLLRLYLRN